MKKFNSKYLNSLKENINLKKKIISLDNKVSEYIEIIFKTLKNKKKIFICGNGGSAADAQHLSAEFLVRLRPAVNRRPLPVISLALDTSTITACGNDYNFDKLFARNLEALADYGDLLICISTSGNSKNILNVLKKAKILGVQTLSLLGNGGGRAKDISSNSILIPSSNTARIQEAHIFIGHVILESVEDKLLKNGLI